LKFGFERFKDEYGVYELMIGTTISKRGKECNLKIKLKKVNVHLYIVENMFSKTIRLEDVHQLQNLYFALTGEELELND
jgi:hypothetical protein